MGKGNGKLKQPDRPTGIGGTDAIRITEGTWKDLWLEKIGKVERKDLSGVLPVQLGIFTEEFKIIIEYKVCIYFRKMIFYILLY